MRLIDRGHRGEPVNEAAATRAARERCNATGDVDACLDLADRAMTGRGAERSADVAVPIYQRACASGSMRACAALGALFLHGVGVARDDARANVLIDAACQGGITEACAFAARARVGEAMDLSGGGD